VEKRRQDAGATIAIADDVKSCAARACESRVMRSNHVYCRGGWFIFDFAAAGSLYFIREADAWLAPLFRLRFDLIHLTLKRIIGG
jgi:hypothetical protein